MVEQRQYEPTRVPHGETVGFDATRDPETSKLSEHAKNYITTEVRKTLTQRDVEDMVNGPHFRDLLTSMNKTQEEIEDIRLQILLAGKKIVELRDRGESNERIDKVIDRLKHIFAPDKAEPTKKGRRTIVGVPKSERRTGKQGQLDDN